MAVSDADFEEMLPSGVRTRFSDRVYWANTHLYQAGLIERPSSGVLAITDRGRAFLAKHQGKILVSDLMQFPEFAAFRKKSSTPPPDPRAAPASEKTPQERIEEAYAELQATLAKELLDKVAASSPTAFERLVIQLLLKMGYGGGEPDASKHSAALAMVASTGSSIRTSWASIVSTSKPSDGRSPWASIESTPLLGALR